MSIILEYIGPILGLASAVITIALVIREKVKYGVLLIILSLVFATATILIWNNIKETKYDVKLLTEKQNYEQLLLDAEESLIAKDAKSIAESVTITGWEDSGDYIGYLATMVGFYKRHSPKYEQEYLTLSRQLDEWQEDLREIRKRKSIISSSDYEGLIGIVKSTRDYLRVIGKSSDE